MFLLKEIISLDYSEADIRLLACDMAPPHINELVQFSIAESVKRCGIGLIPVLKKDNKIYLYQKLVVEDELLVNALRVFDEVSK